MRIAFVGHLSVDRNIVRGREILLYGGGVLHGSVTAKRLGADSHLYTMCAPRDRDHFASLRQADVETTLFESATGTSIRNEYPSENPDERTSRLVSRGRPFALQDIQSVEPADALHLNALWFGELRPELIPEAKKRAKALAGDAQGFLRHAGGDGEMFYRDWDDKESYLPLFDFFKVDIKEAEVLTGRDDYRAAAEALHDMGVREVVLTHRGGVCAFDGKTFHESPFGPFTMEGRTGRGDTCMAAFLVARTRWDLRRATEEAAHVTSKKMQYPGPFRG